MSRYDGSDHYVYPDTGTLINKAELRDQDALDAFEADASAVRMLELIDAPVLGDFDLAHLQAIHRHIFQDVFAWAGELRDVDISRDGSHFGNWALIGPYLDSQLAKLTQENYLRGLAPEDFILRLAWYMSEINAAHPFREGNGRTQRVFCAQLAEQAGYFIDFDTLNQDEMYAVMKASFNGNTKPLADLLDRITSIID